MGIHKKMYYRLNNRVTDAINILQKAQQETEEMYMESKEAEIRVLPEKEINGDAISRKPRKVFINLFRGPNAL